MLAISVDVQEESNNAFNLKKEIFIQFHRKHHFTVWSSEKCRTRETTTKVDMIKRNTNYDFKELTLHQQERRSSHCPAMLPHTLNLNSVSFHTNCVKKLKLGTETISDYLRNTVNCLVVPGGVVDWHRTSMCMCSGLALLVPNPWCVTTACVSLWSRPQWRSAGLEVNLEGLREFKVLQITRDKQTPSSDIFKNIHQTAFDPFHGWKRFTLQDL